VILDIRMRGGSGIDVLECIKRDRPQTVVMMLAKYPEPGYRHRCSGAGAEYFFDKSHDEDVAAVLADLVRA
jgi:DNA-binding NarL/FixJ family response regulator